MAGDAVDEEPGAGLPDPAGLVVMGESVVEVEGAADGEGAVGDVVEIARGPLALAVVDDEGADLERGGVFVLGVGGDVGWSVRERGGRGRG